MEELRIIIADFLGTAPVNIGDIALMYYTKGLPVYEVSVQFESMASKKERVSFHELILFVYKKK